MADSPTESPLVLPLVSPMLANKLVSTMPPIGPPCLIISYPLFVNLIPQARHSTLASLSQWIISLMVSIILYEH